MPAAFDKCRAGGGRIRTKKLKDNKHIHICFDESGSHAGYPMKSHSTKKKGR